MTTFLSDRGALRAAAFALGAAFLGAAVVATPASAQSYGDPYSSYGYQPAPGYDRPDFDVEPTERDAITVFEDAPLSNEPESLGRPLNEFAGENQPFHNGIFGALIRR